MEKGARQGDEQVAGLVEEEAVVEEVFGGFGDAAAVAQNTQHAQLTVADLDKE